MNPIIWFAFVCLFIAAVCFVADWFINLGEGAGSREVRDTEAGVETPSPPTSLPEVLRPIGGLPSWESTRRDR